MNTPKLDTSVKREKQRFTTTQETVKGGTVTHLWVQETGKQWIDVSAKPIKSIFCR